MAGGDKRAAEAPCYGLSYCCACLENRACTNQGVGLGFVLAATALIPFSFSWEIRGGRFLRC